MTPIRPGGAGEVDASIAVWLAALAHRDGTAPVPAVADLAREQFARPIVRFAIAGAGAGADRLTGFALTVASDAVDEATLALLAVLPAEAGRGLGRALLDDAVCAAGTVGCRSIRLKVRTGNAGAIALYRSAGFTAEGEPAPHPLAGDPMVTYRLALSSVDASAG